MGNLINDGGRKAEALAAFRASIAVSPTHAAAYNNMANLVRDEGGDANERAAGRAYAHAVALDPVYVGRALFDRQLGESPHGGGRVWAGTPRRTRTWATC